MKNKIVYADNAGTSFMSAAALEAMLPYMTASCGNPSSIYGAGREAKKGLNEARATVASSIGALPEEVFFTSGGTEADNWAIRGACEAMEGKGKHIITSSVEHHAVTHTLEYLKRKGYEVTCLPVDEKGQISVKGLINAIRSDTVLITIMAANNEIGTVLPIKEIGEAAREAGILFHTDAVQAVGHIPIDVAGMNVDLLSMSAHKFRGPKGVGALYIRRGNSIPPLIYGGGQEKSMRSGTENVAGCAGMAAALSEAVAHMALNMKHVGALRDGLIKGLLKIPRSHLTGDPEKRLPGIASFIFECIEGESLVLMLDAAGICASSGSACSSASSDPSHVLLAAGVPRQIAHGSLRLSLNEENTHEDIDYILKKLPPLVARLRDISPLWEEKEKARR